MPDSRRILRYSGTHFKTQRLATQFAEEFRPLAQRGWECHLVLGRMPDDSDWLTEFKALGVEIHLAPRPARKFDPSCIAHTVRLCRKLKPDVFVCENIHDSPLVGATVARVPVRIWIKRAMNSDFERGCQPTLKSRLALTTRLSCAMSTRVLAVSGAVRDELVGLGIPGSKILVRPNPRRLGGSRTQGREDIRGRLGLLDTDVVWTSVGHAVPVKGWHMLIRAFHKVAQSDQRAKLVLVGSLERPEETATTTLLRAEIERLGLAGNVRFTGKVENIADILSASDAFVMASHSEGFSNSLIEALGAGLPCLATRVGIAADVIRQKVNGMLVDRFNEHDLAEALAEMTGDDSLRAALAGNASVPESIPDLEDYARRMADDFSALVLQRC
jgi:glycosyltransferase involved in cell wall biosynthesis